MKPSGQDETRSSMAQTQVLRKAVLTKNMVIGSQLAPGLRQSGREETKEVKLSISIVLRARMEFLRTTMEDVRLPIAGPIPLASHVISVYYSYTHLSAILSEATVFCVTGGHRG